MISGLPQRDVEAAAQNGRSRRIMLVAAGTLAALILVLALGGEPVNDVLRYDRDGLTRGELWRLITAHLVHLGMAHAALNVVALMLILVLFGPLMRPGFWCIVMIASVLAIDAGLWWFEPRIEWYVGLSGLLHGMLLAAAIVLTARRQRLGVVLLLMILAKLGWEQAFGPLPGSQSLVTGRVVTEAHLFGAAGGLVALMFTGRPRRRPPL